MKADEETAAADSQRKLHLDNNDEHLRSLSPKNSSSCDRPLTDEFTIDESEYNLPTNWAGPEVVEFEGEKVIFENKNIFQSNKLKFQLAASMITLFLIGLTDQTIGSLIEYFLADYQIDRVQLSYLFIAQFCGYIPASILNNYLMSQFGLYFAYYSSCIAVIVAGSFYVLKLSFIFLPFAAICFGWANGTFDCCLNYFVGNLDYSNQLLGLMHALYGVGCLVTPVLSDYLVSKGMVWNHYYYILIATAIANLIMVLLFFKNETSYKYRYALMMNSKSDSSYDNDFDHSSIVYSEPTIFETVANKYIIYYSFSLFIYVGSELGVGVWLNNYLFKIQNLDQKNASKITSSFWLFMTSGRIILGFVTGRYFEDTEIYAIITYSVLVAIGCMSFWIFKNSILFQITSICFAGFFMGPFFSTTVIIALKTLPKRYSIHGISLIAGFGGAGAAVVPAMVGYIAEHFAPNNETDPASGAGLVHFPFTEFVLFSLASSLWLLFYLYNKGTFDQKIRLK